MKRELKKKLHRFSFSLILTRGIMNRSLALSLVLPLSFFSSLSFAALTDENNIYRFYKTPNDKVLHLRQKRFQAIVPFAYLGILEFKIQN